eukprot:scaffold133463_cov78-Phaeocystis_antarctica.AAC.2
MPRVGTVLGARAQEESLAPVIAPRQKRHNEVGGVVAGRHYSEGGGRGQEEGDRRCVRVGVPD